MRGPRPVTPKMEKELHRRMAAGEPLPPGFHAVPEGQVPPVGSVPAGVHTQRNGQPIAPPEDLTEVNPVRADDPNTLTLLRNSAKCPIPDEATRLQKSIQAAISIKDRDADDEEVELVIGRGLATTLRSNTYCETQKKERVAVDFRKDSKLSAMTDEILGLTNEAEELQKKLQEVVQKARKLIGDRWDAAVKTHGLNPAKYIYYVSEDDAQIIELRVDCDTCKGKVKVRKARQEGEALLRRAADAQKATALKSVGLDEPETGSKEPAESEESKDE